MFGNSDKTEKPTPKKRADARDKGQVARSQDVNGVAVLFAGLLVISVFAPRLVATLEDSLRATLTAISSPGLVSRDGLMVLMTEAGRTTAIAVAPIALGCMVAGLLANVGQIRFKLTPKALKPDPKRLNPLSGLKNLLGPKSIFEAVKTVLKVAVVAVVAALALLPQLPELAALVGLPPQALMQRLAQTVLGIAQKAGLAYLVIAAADYAWQRYQHEKSLKMDKQEIKDEAKGQNTPPEVKGAIRRRQMAAARARMMADVPQADVVVTNPTHYAVALRYDGGRPAPEVIAKGQDLLARRIREIAVEHDVPVVSDPPLARSLHAGVEVGHVIPEELYQAVAQLLAFVYRIGARRAAA